MNNLQHLGLSHFWRGILKHLDSFLLSTKVILENGEDTTFWKDYWCSYINFPNLFSDHFNLTVDPDVAVHECKLLNL